MYTTLPVYSTLFLKVCQILNLENLRQTNFVINLQSDNQNQIDMETTDAIRIPNPSRELVAFIKEAQKDKRERMKKICDNYRNILPG